MKRFIPFLLLIFTIGLSHNVSAQCDPPSILWDEDGILLNWIAKDNATSHLLRYRETGTFPWTDVVIEDETFFDISFLDACVSYDFRVRSICENLESSYTPVYETRVNCGTCYKDYCDVPNMSDYSTYIDYFRFKDIEQASPTSSGFGYEDYRGTTERVVGPFEEVEVEFSLSDNSYFEAEFQLYIDYNRNQEFEADELVAEEFVTNSGNVIATFEVPGDINFGITRMRLLASAFSYNPGPCAEDFNFFSTGEVEEYCLLLGELPSACDFEFAADLDNIASGSADFSWEELDAAAAYNVRYKKTSEGDDEWNELATIDPEINITQLDDCDEYEFQVRGVCPFDTSAFKNTIVFNSFCPTDINEAELIVSEITAYPNPWSSNMIIKLVSEKSDLVSVSIYSVDGVQYPISRSQQLSEGENIIEYTSSSNMPAGIYYIEVTDSNLRKQFYKTLKIQ